MTIDVRFFIAKGAFILDVDASLPSRGVTAVYGVSGCGKTTLLRAIAGLERDKKGFVRVEGELWQDGEYFLPPHSRRIGYVFQEPSLFPHLTVRGNLEYGMKRISGRASRISLERAISLLDIDQLLERKTDRLSGGEQQRVAIARALASSPNILLLDEPLSALDLQRKQEIMPYLESLHDELLIPIIYVTHSPDEIACLADYLLLMDQGKIEAAGVVTEMLTRLDLPLTHGSEAAALIPATVSGHDDNFALTCLDFSGGQFCIPRKDLPVGHAVRLRVLARDVSITLEKQSGTSILNIFPALVDEITSEGLSQATVRLMAGSTVVLSRITKKSVASLGLKPGKPVFIQAKSVALVS